MAEDPTPEWCPNCDGRECMACVFREVHDACEKSCPFCCAEPSEGTTEPRERGEAWDVLVPEEGWTVGRIVEDAIETTLDTLADPDVLAEIAQVHHDFHHPRTCRGGCAGWTRWTRSSPLRSWRG